MALETRLYVRGHVGLVGKDDARRGDSRTPSENAGRRRCVKRTGKFGELPLDGATCASGAQR